MPGSQEVPPAAQTIADPSVEENVLSIEEQRVIALKVCIFFICLICATIAILYVYHSIEQRSKDKKDRQSL